jgi:methylthioribose-1-phosphate isomerase
MILSPVQYENGTLKVLDQTVLPWEERYLTLETKEDVWDAIHALKVRGAPAIGIAAAYGLFMLARNIDAKDSGDFQKQFEELKAYLATSRPTAVNLFWAMDRMEGTLLKGLVDQKDNPLHSWEVDRARLLDLLEAEAEAIRTEDEAACKAMGEFGLSLLKPGMGLLTHCNAGTIATARYGTSLAPIYLGHERGYDFKVFAGETRPLMQGARLTSWELHKAGIDVTLICDNMASMVMKNGWIDAVLVGCDRMAANGDGANKIGTSGLAILAKEYGIPFYMFVPTSTIDLSAKTGEDIFVECRPGEEVTTKWFEREMAPKGVPVYNPAFDVTDHRFITAVITEKGIIRPPFEQGLAGLFR